MAEEQKQIDKTSDTPETINSLPLEILEIIFRFLPHLERIRVERVCRKWRAASRNAWKDVKCLSIDLPDNTSEFHRSEKQVEPLDPVIVENDTIYIRTDDRKIIQNLVARIGKNIKKFIFKDNRHEMKGNIYRSVLGIVSNYCCNIETMNYSTPCRKLAQRVLSKLFKVNKKLNSIQSDLNIEAVLPIRDWKCLRIRLPRYTDPHDTERKMVELIKNSPSLEELEIDGRSRNVEAEISKCRELKKLYVMIKLIGIDDFRCPEMLKDAPFLNHLTVLVIMSPKMGTLKDVLSHCTNLKILSVTELNPYQEVVGVNPGVQEFFENLLLPPKLEAIKLMNCHINDEFLLYLTKFKHLSFNADRGAITLAGFIAMIKCSERLETLSIEYVTCTFPPNYLQVIVEQTRDRAASLYIDVHYDNYQHASETCKNSKIQIVRGSDYFKFLDTI